MATPTSEWMTRAQLEARYKGLWVESSRSKTTIKTVDTQLEMSPNPDKAVVFAMATDKAPAKATVAQVNLVLRVFAARKKNGVWLFSEDREDIDFVIAEISGLTVSEYRARRDERSRRELAALAGGKA